ncbi:serine hydrolase domain-containing protein [Actinomadura rubrisoli]|uniref:Class A beta-lactamase-related serine hydrolase n=1 Tax=Actinomadura rubrisoli TaxID=2530368 RepID=A0A4R5AKI7_9ACTN|nr:serine hydrolase domain-containing protein [Actinomadura rubrisoli]TDD71514.1 class A beta-lactamase-related serine hydrolase [Actinomadura rubrisoli]
MITRNMVLGGAATVALALTVTATAGPAKADGHTGLRQAVERLTEPDGAPGALAEVNDRNGRLVITSGVADIRTGAPVNPRSRFRIGSLTKPFVATVALQLVGEGRIKLDAPVERYLPGVVRGADNDGREITVRQLLQQTSGLPDVLKFLPPQEILKDPLRHWETRDLVNIALQHPRNFTPGEKWGYSNTNYLLAGMIIESVTGHPYGREIRRRVIHPLGLHDTFVPNDAPAIPAPHPRGYVRPESDLVDITRLNPTVGGAAGGMISSASNVNRFLAALLRGRLLKPAQLREMLDARPTGRASESKYGLGLQWLPVKDSPTCSDGYWGHDGDMLGFSTRAGTTMDGRQATVMVNLKPGGGPALDDAMSKILPIALCGNYCNPSRTDQDRMDGI